MLKLERLPIRSDNGFNGEDLIPKLIAIKGLIIVLALRSFAFPIRDDSILPLTGLTSCLAIIQLTHFQRMVMLNIHTETLSQPV